MVIKPWELFKLIEETDYQKTGDDVDYAIKLIDGVPFLLFQASGSKTDWKNNLCFPRRLYKNQQKILFIHSGFAHAWKSANDVIMDQLTQEVYKAGQNPVIAGWSFGGAMAQLAAEDFYFRTGIKSTVYTFGAPKVAGGHFTKMTIKEAGDFLQYANVNDCVPLMPPLPGYTHINKIKIGKPFHLLELFHPERNHTSYGNIELYEETND